MAERKKLAAKRTGARKISTKKTPPKRVVIGAFTDLPGAKPLLAKRGVPAKLASRGFYCAREGLTGWLFDKHPETKLPAAVARGGLAVIRRLCRQSQDEIRAVLGGRDDDFEIGFHADLDAPALSKAFADEGFQVSPFPSAKLAGVALEGSDPWSAALDVLESGDADVRKLLAAIDVDSKLRPPPDKVMTLIADNVGTTDDLRAVRHMLELAKADLVAGAIPFVARRWKPKRAKAKPRGLPPALTTLLGAFDGIPALNVWTAGQIAKQHKRLLSIAAGAKKVGKRDWGVSPKEIRTDRFWRDGWIPFCQRPDDQYLAIDLDPTKQGTKGQVIGVHLNPPRLSRYRSTFGEWLWNELETALRAVTG